jgi:virginiamycin B lyase
MFTHRILVLDPATGATETVPMPIESSGPRAIELDRAGNWWVLLGAANSIGRYDPNAGRWQTAEVGFYGHSIAIDADGAAWTNDHFARPAPKLTRIGAAAGGRLSVTTLSGPPFSSAAPGPTPIPYELRVAPDGRLWLSLLHGNQLVAYDPTTGAFETVTLPDPDAGPRRFDVDAAGRLWIPGYASSVLYRYDPATRAFERHPLPIADALPYVARVDPRDGTVWIGTGAADAVLRFDPRTAKFAVHPVPTRGATMRHLAIDPTSGDLWIAYGASPAIHPTRVARLRRR